MAIDAGTLWEFRAASGSATNGGGYSPDVSGAGTDYSNQDSAQETYTTLTTSGAGVTTVTCSGGDTFDANIVGNVINIASGTNATAQWIQVTARASSTLITVDRAPDDGVGGIASGVGSMGGALDIVTDGFIEGNLGQNEVGNKTWIKDDGTATLGAISTTRNHTAAAPLVIEGYNLIRGDNPTGLNRPLLASGANSFQLNDYVDFINIRHTTTNGDGFRLDQKCKIENSSFNNSSAFGGRAAVRMGAESLFELCESQSVNGYAFYFTGNSVTAVTCYAHDSYRGFHASGYDGHLVWNCIADTCAEGLYLDQTNEGMRALGCVFYNCTTAGIHCAATNSGGINLQVFNCIFHTCVTGINFVGTDEQHRVDHNCWYNNTTDIANGSIGSNAVESNPLLTDPANGDFTLGSGSPTIDTGLKHSTATGVVGTYKQSIGVDQTDHSPVTTSTGRQWMLAGAGAISQDEGVGGGGGGSPRLINGGLVS